MGLNIKFSLGRMFLTNQGSIWGNEHGISQVDYTWQAREMLPIFSVVWGMVILSRYDSEWQIPVQFKKSISLFICITTKENLAWWC